MLSSTPATAKSQNRNLPDRAMPHPSASAGEERPVANTTPSVTEVNNLFFKDRENRAGRNAPEKLAYQKHVGIPYGDIPIDRLNGTMIRKVIEQMKRDHKRPGTIDGIIITGRREHRYAMEHGWVRDNPWENIKLLPNDDLFSTSRPIDARDIQVLEDQFRNMDTMGRFMSLTLCPDFRDVQPNMLLAVLASDYDDANSTITFRGSLVGNSAQYKPHAPFTLHLTSRPAALIREEMSRRERKKAACEPDQWHDSPDFLFCDWYGGPIDRQILGSFIHVVQLNTGFEWFSIQRLHGHVKTTTSNFSVVRPV